MKKLMGVFVGLLVFMSVFAGCNNQKPSTKDNLNEKTMGNQYSRNDIPTTVGNNEGFVNESLQGQANPTAKGNAIFLSVLNNEITFVDETGKSVYLKNYNVFSERSAVEGEETIPQKYTQVDFDGDGNDEMVLYVTPDFGAYLVFHIYNGQVYGFEFTERALMDLKKDGSFMGSSGAGNTTYLALSFKDEKYELHELAYQYDMTEKKVYKINGKDVTAEEFDIFYEAFRNKPNVDWIEMTN